MFQGVYSGKKVLVTGHTGFKGSWLSAWLVSLGADVVGYSKDVPTEPSMFRTVGLDEKIKTVWGDVRDLDMLTEVVREECPDFVFHLAAQPIVSISYVNPVETISANVVGTMNVLEALRVSDVNCAAVMITSDKCYDNVEQAQGYREVDSLGGKDIYSGSKGAAELVIKSYFHSFFKSPDCCVKVGIGRAGNVIGGGDWAKDRIVVDSINAWMCGKSVEIRSPASTRPWQHVLEPLSGYLTLGMLLLGHNELSGEPFNFGPGLNGSRTVLELIEDLAESTGLMSGSSAYTITDNKPFHEAGLLKLNCDKAMDLLNWNAVLSYEQTVGFVGDWYSEFCKKESDMFKVTMQQIKDYEHEAESQGMKWTE